MILYSDIETVVIVEVEILVEVRVVKSGQYIDILFLVEYLNFLIGVHDDDGH